jgi:hypothetical protein
MVEFGYVLMDAINASIRVLHENQPGYTLA